VRQDFSNVRDEAESALMLEARHATGPDTWTLRQRRIAPWYTWRWPRYRRCTGVG
jgi:hypothetical protein